jgi:hypothetical protein
VDVVQPENDKPVHVDPQDTHANGYVLDDTNHHCSTLFLTAFMLSMKEGTTV